MNSLWAKYGCTKCDAYPVLVLTANFSDAKSSFQTNFITKYGVKTPCVPKEDGGATFNTALNNQNYGGPKYLIKPDKTVIGSVSGSSATETDIINAGIKQHVCTSPITQNLTNQKINSNIALYNVSKHGFAVNVQTEGTYSIAFYSANGKLKSMVSHKNFSTGYHKINLELNNGFYLVEINNGDNIIREKVIVK